MPPQPRRLPRLHRSLHQVPSIVALASVQYAFVRSAPALGQPLRLGPTAVSIPVPFRRVLEDEPGDTAARSHRAYALRRLDNYAAAVSDYSVALAAAPTAMRLYNARGNVCSQIIAMSRIAFVQCMHAPALSLAFNCP